MNFDLSEEQVLLQEAARGVIAGSQTVNAARQMLEGADGPDLWQKAREVGWPGLLVSEERGGAGLGVMDSALVTVECGRSLASVPLLGHLPATALLDRAENVSEHAELIQALAGGELRAAYVPASPPSDTNPKWSVQQREGYSRAQAPLVVVQSGKATVNGTVAWVPDLPGSDRLVVACRTTDGKAAAVLLETDQAGIQIEPVTRYDATRKLGHLTLTNASGKALTVTETDLGFAWYLCQTLLAAESLGASEACLEMALGYAKERYTFGRPIGSYQAIKHALVEILRLSENARSLLYYSGLAEHDLPDEFPLAASAARAAADKALEYASRECISVHGGIGATWEHDAPLYFRKSQLSRLLLGGTDGSLDRVAAELLTAT